MTRTSSVHQKNIMREGGESASTPDLGDAALVKEWKESFFYVVSSTYARAYVLYD